MPTTLNVNEAKANFSGMLAEVEPQHQRSILGCAAVAIEPVFRCGPQALDGSQAVAGADLQFVTQLHFLKGNVVFQGGPQGFVLGAVMVEHANLKI